MIRILPFQFMIFFPMQIYLGKIPMGQVFYEFLIEGTWIAALSFLNWMIWKKGARHYVAMGE